MSLIAAAALAVASLLIPAGGEPAPPATPAAVAQAPATQAPATQAPTTQPTATAEPSPVAPTAAAAEPTQADKATPIPEPTSALISPLPAPAKPTPTPGTVPPNKRLVLNAIASGIDEAGMPVDAGTAFSSGLKSIYVFFDFRDVPPSALLRHSWFRDGGSVYFRSERFGLTGNGMSYVEWAPRGGLRPGLYEVRLALGGVSQFVANFEVK